MTAVDNSAALSQLAFEQFGLTVRIVDMIELDYRDYFDAIWASASILHISRAQIGTVLDKCHQALHNQGIFYVSFKYRDLEEIKNGRFFNSYTPQSLTPLMQQHGFECVEAWVTQDVRPERKEERWTNGIFRK